MLDKVVGQVQDQEQTLQEQTMLETTLQGQTMPEQPLQEQAMPEQPLQDVRRSCRERKTNVKYDSAVWDLDRD